MSDQPKLSELYRKRDANLEYLKTASVQPLILAVTSVALFGIFTMPAPGAPERPHILNVMVIVLFIFVYLSVFMIVVYRNARSLLLQELEIAKRLRPNQPMDDRITLLRVLIYAAPPRIYFLDRKDPTPQKENHE